MPGQPPPSKTQDTYSHDTSPNAPAAPQVMVPKPPKASREITGTPYSPKLPPHVTKHPNPVGRPKNPRE